MSSDVRLGAIGAGGHTLEAAGGTYADPVESALRTGRDLATLPSESRLHAEDLGVGDWMDLGSTTVSRDEIIAFAHRFDLLPVHLDGADSHFGHAIAVGVHTMALFSSLASRVFYPRLVLVAGKGIDRLRFPHPVRPEAVLRGSVDIVKIVRHALWADVHYLSTMVDLDENVVLSYVGIVAVSRRET